MSPQSGYPRANQDLSVCYGEGGGTSCFNDDRVIGLHNLVTERAVIGQYDLIVERERYHSRNLVTERARRSLLTPEQTRSVLPTVIKLGSPGTNQDFVCLLWGGAEK